MAAYLSNIESQTKRNKNYRKVINTTTQQQLVLMNIPLNEEIGREKHSFTTQFIKIEDGTGLAIINDDDVFEIGPGDVVMIPPNTYHNIISTAPDGLKLYTIYSPPEHKRRLIQKTKPLEEDD